MIRAASSTLPFGHPRFDDLDVGDQVEVDICAAYLDLSKFTGRSFWDPLSEVTDLAQAVLTQFAEVVSDFGGHVLGTRGDGLFAGWGDVDCDPSVQVTAAVAGCSFAINATRGALNDELRRQGRQEVIAKAGVDYGRVTFVRVGSDGRSEVNVVGFPANFAAKCEKEAYAWEIVAGEGATNLIDDEYLTSCDNSPKRYTRDGETRSYSFQKFEWDQAELLDELSSIPDELHGTPSFLLKAHG